MRLEPGMILDVFVIGILLFSTIAGVKKGFARTCFSFMQWFICMIAGFFLCVPVKKCLISYTTLDESIKNYVANQIKTSIEESTLYQSLPDLFGAWLQADGKGFVYDSSTSLTDIILTVLAFLLILLAMKFVGGLLMLLFSKDYHSGVIGFLDSLLGFLFGGVRGILILLVFFALLVPALTLLPGTLSATLKTAMDQSLIASILYDDNLLLILLRDLFS